MGDVTGATSILFTVYGTELKNMEARMDEVEKRVAEVEEWNANAKDLLLQTLQDQECIQSKLTDLEACSRRNNLRIYGIPEGEEGADRMTLTYNAVTDHSNQNHHHKLPRDPLLPASSSTERRSWC